MDNLPEPLSALIGELEKLPTIGPKTAARLAYHIMSRDRDDAGRLADAIRDVKDRVRTCERCFSLTDRELCAICRDPRRDPHVVCVVGEAKDVYAVERAQAFNGRYHVLGGLISPMEGIGPEQLTVKQLVERVAAEGITELIVATNPNAEGESTAHYLHRLLAPLHVNVTRVAYGLPAGGDLDYADEVTLARALDGRTAM